MPMNAVSPIYAGSSVNLSNRIKVNCDGSINVRLVSPDLESQVFKIKPEGSFTEFRVDMGNSAVKVEPAGSYTVFKVEQR